MWAFSIEIPFRFHFLEEKYSFQLSSYFRFRDLIIYLDWHPKMVMLESISGLIRGRDTGDIDFRCCWYLEKRQTRKRANGPFPQSLYFRFEKSL